VIDPAPSLVQRLVGPPAIFRIDQLKAHQEYRNSSGKLVPGVTRVLDILDKPGLINWAWRNGRDGIDLEKARNSAADVGTVCHARVEAWLRGMDFDSSNVTEEQMVRSGIGFERFRSWWLGQELSVLACEQDARPPMGVQMVSERMQVGGTADVVALRPNGRRLLIDVKSSNGIYREMRMQVSAYAAMWEEMECERLSEELSQLAGEPVLAEGPPIDEVWIVRVGKAEADEIEAVQVLNRERYLAAFIAVAGAYHALKGLR